MSKYFAKFLPVQGEPDLGKMCLFQGRVEMYTEYHWREYCQCEVDNVPNTIQKVQLFLCSREIEVGDKMESYVPVGEHPYTREEGICLDYLKEDDTYTYRLSDGSKTNCGAGYCFKVIGPISPQATWVKEGMEFDEEEVKLIERHPYIFHKTGQCIGGEVEGWNEWLPKYNECQIKCRCCNTLK